MAIIRGTYVTRLAGKVGNVVYRNRGGQNIASEKPATVKNPRSNAQQRQRMVFATVSAAYSAMKEICDHSFEGITYGADNMAEFMRRNLSIMKSRTKFFNSKGNPYMIPNPYLISRGSLPTIPVGVNQTGLEEVDDTPAIAIQIPTMTLSTTNATTYTVAQLHNDLGIEIGDQITLLGVSNAKNGERISSGVAPVQYQTTFVYARLVFDATKGRGVLFSEGAINAANLAPESQNANAIALNTSKNGFALKSALWEVTGEDLCAAAVIISRKNGADWMRSTQTLVTNEENVSIEYTDADMLPSYLPTGEKYLNNAAV